MGYLLDLWSGPLGGRGAITRTGSFPRSTFSRTCLPIWPVGVVTTIIAGRSVPSLYPAVNDLFGHGPCPAVHDRRRPRSLASPCR